MNRIYQGRITGVEVKNGEKWEPPSNWGEAMWKHHKLFQDAVNYYSLMLAVMAKECGDTGFRDEYLRAFTKDKEKVSAAARLKAAVEWAESVKNTWEKARKRAVEFEGPGQRVSKILGCEPAFDSCEKAIKVKSSASSKDRAMAVLYLLERANKSDLNQVCRDELARFCDKDTIATPKDKAQKHKSGNRDFIIDLHESDGKNLKELSDKVNPYLFITKEPSMKKEDFKKEEAIKRAIKYFDDIVKKEEKGGNANVSGIKGLRNSYEKAIKEQIEEKKLFGPGVKTTGAFPYAVVFRYLPVSTIWDLFKKRTQGEYRKIKRQNEKGEIPPVQKDYINALRVASGNKNPFEFFTNQVMPNPKNIRASWFDFDLAAFMEAIAAPHRYFEDTQSREELAGDLRKKIALYDGEGGEIKTPEEDDEYSGQSVPGFKDDGRITLLKELVSDKLAYIAEAEGDISGGKAEYSISPRTLRGYRELREKWLKLAEKKLEPAKLKEKLKETLVEAQSSHRDDFGSAPLFDALIEYKYQPIWRDKGTKDYHAEDVLKAWSDYKELLLELKDKTRSIRYTPAHSTESPRYFDFPKGGALGAKHLAGLTAAGKVQLTAHIAMESAGDKPYKQLPVRITYSAPRLRRDGLRKEGQENLEKAPWVQPMMASLGISELDTQDFAKTKVTLMPYGPGNIQLVFPVEINSDKLRKKISGGTDWASQFNFGRESLSSLRWPTDKKPKKPPEKSWWEKIESFSCLSVDLGQRDAGAYARLEISKKNSNPCRYIGSIGEDKWYAKVVNVGLLKLPGEDAKVWRKGPDGKFGQYEEFSGSRGRIATAKESTEAENLFAELDFDTKSQLGENWKTELSFPEQNDKLLVAARRQQSRLSRLHRWAFFLNKKDKVQVALNEIKDCSDGDLVCDKWKTLAAAKPELLSIEISDLLRKRQEELPDMLIRIANRVLPLRGRSWKWGKNSRKDDCFLLTQNGSALEDVKICGQRGLSMIRLEQLTELRKRFQSMNQMLRRRIGEKAPARRDDSIPDCCPDILEKLDNIKEQRVNQTAHMILAKALGLELAEPSKIKENTGKDIHGSYVKKHSPVSFIVVENLSRYLTSQGRAPRENSRLMKWSHRAVTEKLKMLCEVFYPSIPVGKKKSPMMLETPAAYSSRFCSRSGVPGFRAVEVGPGFDRMAPWVWLKDKKEKDGSPAVIGREIAKAKELVEQMNKGVPEGKPTRTIFLPLAGGPVFIPLVREVKGVPLQPKIVQADINAAINLGLRAVASPEEWSIYPRLRTKREGKKDNKKLLANEKRLFGDTKVELKPLLTGKETEKDESRNPNYFADLSGAVGWGYAQLDGNKTPALVSGKALWGTVRQAEWKRCMEINQARAGKIVKV